MDLSALQSASWPDLVALALFASCAAAGLAVLVRASHPGDDEPELPAVPPAQSPDAWLRESLRGAGYELITVSRGHRVLAGALGEFGFTSGGPGWVRRLRVKTWDGSVREGWLSVCGEPVLQPSGQGDSRAQEPRHLEITWDY